MSIRTSLVVIAILMAGVVRLQMVRERSFPEAEPAQQILYVSSPAVITRLALSYDAIVADLYWIRAIQHYGGTRLSDRPDKSYDLLFPLPFYRFQQQENLQLVKLKQAAHSSHEAGRITDCVRLLESYWPRFLMAYTPVVERPMDEETAPKQIAISPRPPADPSQEPRPGVGERLKGLFKLR